MSANQQSAADKFETSGKFLINDEIIIDGIKNMRASVEA